jgi:hypothetical protein
MGITVAQMTPEDLRSLIRDTVKEALLESLLDPDVGLELRAEFESRLHESLAYIEGGGELIPLEEMLRRLNSE